MAKKPVLIFTNWKTAEESESGKFEVTAMLNGREWTERASLKLVDKWVALERMMHEAACTAINWSDEFKNPTEVARMKQYGLPDILDFFETYQTETFKSKTRRFQYSSLIAIAQPVIEPKVIPHTVEEEKRVSESRNVIIDMINFITDPNNVVNPEVQCPKTFVGRAWDLECDLRIQYAVGNAFVKGFLGDRPFMMFHQLANQVKIYMYEFGETPDTTKASTFLPGGDKIALLGWFKREAEEQKNPSK